MSLCPNESIVSSVEALWITPIKNSPFLLSTNKKLPLRSRDLKCIHTVYYNLIRLEPYGNIKILSLSTNETIVNSVDAF